jgi:hypothetical protein
MIKHEKTLSANSKADRLWKEFDRSLDGVSVTDDQISWARDDRNIQCLSYRALAVIIGKIQVALGAMEMQQTSESSDGELPLLHAKLQVLGGTMFPYLAVRLKQSPRTVLENAIDALRTPSEKAVVDVVQEGSTKSTNETEQSENAASHTSSIETPASDADSSAGSASATRGGGVRRRK